VINDAGSSGAMSLCDVVVLEMDATDVGEQRGGRCEHAGTRCLLWRLQLAVGVDDRPALGVEDAHGTQLLVGDRQPEAGAVGDPGVQCVAADAVAAGRP
jgi:hypothetical protein